MRICRYDDDRLGVVEGGLVFDATTALEVLPALRWPLPPGDALIANWPAIAPRLARATAHAAGRPLDEVTLQSPVANPGKIIGAPVNYRTHFDEVLEQPELHHDQPIKTIEQAGLFLKSSTSLTGPGRGIALRFVGNRRSDHEVELAVVIGRTADRVARSEALACVFGYTIGLDITVRGPEERSLRKSPDGYTVLGPWLVTADEIPDPGQLGLSLEVNGRPRQRSNTAALVFDVARLIEYASSFYTLHPGDVILTGTPEGVGPLEPGDRITASIDAIGSMQVAVRELEPAARTR